MAVLVPLSISGQETAGAILHSTGSGVFVNESTAPPSIAVFPNDVIKTQRNVAAQLQFTGSEAEIDSETILQFNPSELALDHGKVTINTSRGLRVRVGCFVVTPVREDQWTHYEVLDVNGKVTVSALKEDVYVDLHSKNLQPINDRDRQRNRILVREGEQKSHQESRALGPLIAAPAAIGPALNSPYAIGAAGVGIGAIGFLALYHNDDPVSPAKP